MSPIATLAQFNTMSTTTSSITAQSNHGASEVVLDKETKGAVVFTGPDGVGDHRVFVEAQQYTGHTTSPWSPEATGDLNYIGRAPQARID